jgi:hypothetical protein
MVRARIRLETSSQVTDFVRELNSDGTINKYTIENSDGTYRVNARSYLGVLYASAEFKGILYLVNETNNDPFPVFIDKYRPLSEDDGDYIHT